MYVNGIGEGTVSLTVSTLSGAGKAGEGACNYIYIYIHINGSLVPSISVPQISIFSSKILLWLKKVATLMLNFSIYVVT